MANESLIPIEELSARYKIEVSFIHTLVEYGLVEITTVEETQYLQEQELKDLEKIIRLHYDLDINLAGIDAISHLLHRVESMQSELMALKNRLRLYENE